MNLLQPYTFDIENSKYLDCSICLKSFEETPSENLMQIPNCEHVFHESCLRRWFLQAQICPMCRGTIIRMPPDHQPEFSQDDIRVEGPQVVAAAAAGGSSEEEQNHQIEFHEEQEEQRQ